VDLSGIGDGEYGNARVDSVVARSEPVRVPADPNNYARTEIRIQVFWVAA
jgi:hypothetical protein